MSHRGHTYRCGTACEQWQKEKDAKKAGLIDMLVTLEALKAIECWNGR